MSEIDRAAALELKRRFDSGEKLTRGQLGRLRGFSGDLDRKIETEFARRARAGGFGDVFTESEERFNRAERAEAKAVALHDNRQIVINMQVDNDEDAAEATKQELLRRLKELEAKFERRAARQRDVAEDRANQAPRPS